MSDCLRLIGENAAREHGGSYIAQRYAALAGFCAVQKEDARSAEEIIDDVLARAGIEVV